MSVRTEIYSQYLFSTSFTGCTDREEEGELHSPS